VIQLAIWTIILSTGDDSPPIPLTEIPNAPAFVFDKDIYPILESKCLTCHDKEGGLAEGELDLTSVDGLIRGGKHGVGLTSGQGEGSLIFLRSSRRLKPFMPPEGEGDPLTSEELTKLKLWIDQGAKPGENTAPAKSRSKGIAWESLPAGLMPALAIALSPDGTRVACSHGNVAVVRDATSGAAITSLGGQTDFVQSIAWSPDGKRLAVGSHGKVRLWTVAADSAWPDPIVLQPISERANAIAFSPDGSLIAVGAGLPSASGEITVWQSTDGKEIKRLADAHSDLVTGLAFSPDGQLLASSSADKFVKVFKVADYSLTKSLEGHTGAVLGITWSPDGKQIASAGADSALKIWNVEAGEQAASITDHKQEVTAVRFLPGKREIMTTAGDRLGRIWNADDGKLLRVLQGASDFLLSLDVSTNGKVLLAGSQTGEVHLWNADDGQPLRTLSPTPAPAP
jgi:dipeptidyl aminopeptidase/acylaminoacyl peptidase